MPLPRRDSVLHTYRAMVARMGLIAHMGQVVYMRAVHTAKAVGNIRPAHRLAVVGNSRLVHSWTAVAGCFANQDWTDSYHQDADCSMLSPFPQKILCIRLPHSSIIAYSVP